MMVQLAANPVQHEAGAGYKQHVSIACQQEVFMDSFSARQIVIMQCITDYRRSGDRRRLDSQIL